MTKQSVYTWDSGKTLIKPVIRVCRCCHIDYYYSKNSNGYCSGCNSNMATECDHKDRNYSRIFGGNKSYTYEKCRICNHIRTIRRKEDEY